MPGFALENSSLSKLFDARSGFRVHFKSSRIDLFDGVRFQVDEIYPLESGDVTGSEDDRRRNPRFKRLLPTFRAETPPIARLQTRKSVLRNWRNQVVSRASGKLQKLVRRLNADHVLPDIVESGFTATGSEKTRFRGVAARFQGPSQYIHRFRHNSPFSYFSHVGF